MSVSTSRSQQQPGGAGQQVRDALGRGVRAVRGAEGVVDVDVGERRVALGELGVVLRLARLEADVLEHHDVAVGHVVEVGRPSATSVAEQLAQALGDRPQRELGLAVLRPAEVRRRARSRAPRSRSSSMRRQRGADARVVGDPRRPRSGTLKSTRTRTRLPSTSTSSSVLSSTFWSTSTKRFE